VVPPALGLLDEDSHGGEVVLEHGLRDLVLLVRHQVVQFDELVLVVVPPGARPEEGALEVGGDDLEVVVRGLVRPGGQEGLLLHGVRAQDVLRLEDWQVPPGLGAVAKMQAVHHVGQVRHGSIEGVNH